LGPRQGRGRLAHSLSSYKEKKKEKEKPMMIVRTRGEKKKKGNPSAGHIYKGKGCVGRKTASRHWAREREKRGKTAIASRQGHTEKIAT